MTLMLAPAEEILHTFGHRIRDHRLAQALSQQDLAHMADLSLGAVRNLERSGQTSLDTLVRVAQALGLVGELEQLFVLQRHSIAQMELAESVSRRQRAPRRRTR